MLPHKRFDPGLQSVDSDLGLLVQRGAALLQLSACLLQLGLERRRPRLLLLSTPRFGLGLGLGLRKRLERLGRLCRGRSTLHLRLRRAAVGQRGGLRSRGYACFGRRLRGRHALCGALPLPHRSRLCLKQRESQPSHLLLHFCRARSVRCDRRGLYGLGRTAELGLEPLGDGGVELGGFVGESLQWRGGGGGGGGGGEAVDKKAQEKAQGVWGDACHSVGREL